MFRSSWSCESGGDLFSRCFETLDRRIVGKVMILRLVLRNRAEFWSYGIPAMMESAILVWRVGITTK